jgi:ABC-type polysaccharide/polyol phosphate transport system ATPase subunit
VDWAGLQTVALVDGRVSGILELGGGFNPNLTGRQNVMTAGILMV